MEEFTRDDLLALLDDLGGADKASLQDADDNYLAAIVKNRILLVADIARIDKALAKIMPMEWRAELMMHRNTLERAAQAVREAASGRQPPCGNLVVNIPEGRWPFSFSRQERASGLRAARDRGWSHRDGSFRGRV